MKTRIKNIAALMVVAALTATSACTSLPANTVDGRRGHDAAMDCSVQPSQCDRNCGLYAKDAVFFGTSSPVLRDNPELVWDYFKDIGSRGTSTLVLGDHRVQIFGNVAVNTGFYIRKATEAGKPIESPARFTFVYQWRAGRWVIVEHHSSSLPRSQP